MILGINCWKILTFVFLTFVLLKSLSILNLIKESQKMGVASFYMLLYDNYGVSVLAYTSLSWGNKDFTATIKYHHKVTTIK